MKRFFAGLVLCLIVFNSVYIYGEEDKEATYEVFWEKVNNKGIKDIKEIQKYNEFISDFVSEKFTDCVKGSWYEKSVGYLVGMGIVGGYSDQTFRPNNNIKVDEFIAFTVRALKYQLIYTEGYWGSTYIETAKANKLLDGLDITNYKRPITRGEIGVIVSNAIDGNFNMELNMYKKLIYDFKEIENNQKESILTAFSNGVIGGYSDNTFRSNDVATRAEATSIIVRLLDKDARRIPILESHDIKGSTFNSAIVYNNDEIEIYKKDNVKEFSGLRDIAVTDDYVYLLCGSDIRIYDKEMNFIEILDTSKYSIKDIFQLFTYDDYILASSRVNDDIMKIQNKEIKWNRSFGSSLIYTNLAKNNYDELVARRENYGEGLLATIDLDNYSSTVLFRKKLSESQSTTDFAFIDDMLFLTEPGRVVIWSVDGKKIDTIDLDNINYINAFTYSSYYDRIFVLADNNLTVVNPYTLKLEKTYKLPIIDRVLYNIVVDNDGNFYGTHYDKVYIMENNE